MTKPIKWSSVLMAATAIFAVVSIGYIAYRDYHNTHLCKQKYGVPAQWEGKNICSMEAGKLR